MCKFIQYICLPLALAIFSGCTNNETVDNDTSRQARVRFEVAPLAFGTGDGVVFSSARIIAVDNKGKVAYNQTTATGLSLKPGATDIFDIELPAGNYLLYIVVNETPAMGRQLDAVGSVNDMKTVTVEGSFNEESVPLAQTEQISLREKNGRSQVSADGGTTWQERITTELVRTQSKATLYVRKMTGAGDVIVIKKVEVCNLPDRCYLLRRAYTPAKENMQTITPYDDTAGIRFDTDIADETSKDNYTPIFTSGCIFPERWTDTPESGTDSAYLKIYADYNGMNTVYTIPLHGDSENGYNLARNVNHIIYATITSAGELDTNKIYIEPRWWTEEVGGDIEAPFLNVSETSVPIVFSRSTDGMINIEAKRIFFWSNVPENEISVSDKVETETGDIYDIAGHLSAEIHITKSDPATGGGYNTAGYIELIPSARLSRLAFNNDATEYRFYMKAGHLAKKLTLERVDYLPSTRFSEIPWTGIFYTATQKGERIISAQNEGIWTATTEYPSGTAEFVLLDPSLSTDETIYTDTPTDAEMFPITSGVQTLSGEDRIYFRVGLTGTSTTSRTARIRLETTSGTYYIYVKQGKYDYVMRSTDPASAINSDGSLGSSVTRTSASVKSLSQVPLIYSGISGIGNGGSELASQYYHSNYYTSPLTETGFPTTAQQFFCWNRYNGYYKSGSYSSYYYSYIFHPTNPWTGPITPYPYTSALTPSASYDTAIYRDGCPSGYRQPTVDQLRNSLFNNIPEKGPDSNYAMAANAEDRNYQWGYYADGYFDRRKAHSVESTTESGTVTTPPCAVGSGTGIAYWGILFYNPATYTSLFLPATGYRDAANGELRMPGLGGFLWAQDGASATSKYGLSFSYTDGNLDCRIMGGIHPARGASIRCVKL